METTNKIKIENIKKQTSWPQGSRSTGTLTGIGDRVTDRDIEENVVRITNAYTGSKTKMLDREGPQGEGNRAKERKQETGNGIQNTE